MSEKETTNEMAEVGMKKREIRLSLKECSQVGSVTQEGHEVPLEPESGCSRKIKPRALIFKANDKDLHEIKEIIKTQFPKVEIIYVTTGPAASILRVYKSLPFETQNSSTQPLYTIE